MVRHVCGGEVNIQHYFISKEAIEIIKLKRNNCTSNKLRECILSHYTHLELLFREFFRKSCVHRINKNYYRD